MTKPPRSLLPYGEAFNRVWNRRSHTGERFGQRCRVARMVNRWTAEFEFEDGGTVIADTWAVRASK